MLGFLPSFMKGPLSAGLFVLNTILWAILLLPFAFLKALIPIKDFRTLCTRVMVLIGEQWIAWNSANIALTQKVTWDVRGIEDLHLDRSYLVIANHLSWMDIVTLQHVFNRKIPFLRFFLKKELIYVPLLGVAWWALDFPFMKRYSKEYLQKHPEKRGEDLKTTRKACEAFRGSSISVLNFLEGTRFKREKHEKQRSPFKHLLWPKAGGIAFVLEAMGDQFDSLVDVTIYYQGGPVTLWQAFSGKLSRVVVHIRKVAIPPELLEGNYLDDPQFRERMQAWVTDLWQQKDQLITELRTESLREAF
jgi:1-acyl-sn-glycerol-3-phosphate acyltransferase